MRKILLGFDIGGTKCAVCLGDMTGMPIDKIKFLTTPGFESVWLNLLEQTAALLKKHDLKTIDIAAVGVSCGGPLDAKRGVVMSPPNLPGWDDIHIVEKIESEFNVPAFLMNDANACALAEWRFGAGEKGDNMIFLTMGTGLGGGVILNGQLYDGASGMAGEFGHIRLRPDGPRGFNKEGSFEGFCGGGGIADHARIIAGTYPDQASVEEYCQLVGGRDFAMKNLDVAQVRGNAFARHMFEVTGEMLGHGLAVLIDSFNPDRIVIGSIFERSEVELRPAMEKILREEALPESLEQCQILPAKLGDQIGDYACLLVAKHGLDNRVYKIAMNSNNNQRVDEVFEELFQDYPQLESCRGDIRAFYENLVKVFAAGGKLLICGNGGSAADAQHIVGELMKDFAIRRGIAPEDGAKLRKLFPDGSGAYLSNNLARALPAISLCNEQALNSAIANDVDGDMVYAQQVYGLCSSADALLALSTSGNSLNVVNAVKTAKIKGAMTLVITGERESKLSSLCDMTLRLPTSETYRIQEYTLPIYHALCRMLELYFFIPEK